MIYALLHEMEGGALDDLPSCCIHLATFDEYDEDGDVYLISFPNRAEFKKVRIDGLHAQKRTTK